MCNRSGRTNQTSKKTDGTPSDEDSIADYNDDGAQSDSSELSELARCIDSDSAIEGIS